MRACGIHLGRLAKRVLNDLNAPFQRLDPRHPMWPRRIGGIIIVDAAAPDQLGIQLPDAPRCVIDHHATHGWELGPEDHRLVRPVRATTQLVHAWMRHAAPKHSPHPSERYSLPDWSRTPVDSAMRIMAPSTPPPHCWLRATSITRASSRVWNRMTSHDRIVACFRRHWRGWKDNLQVLGGFSTCASRSPRGNRLLSAHRIRSGSGSLFEAGRRKDADHGQSSEERNQFWHPPRPHDG